MLEFAGVGSLKTLGGVSEWSIEIVLKTIRGDEPLEGSNPSPTAKKTKAMANILVSWEAKEYAHYEKGPGWYLTLTILAILFVAFQILMKDYFAAFTIAFLYFILFIYARLTPSQIQVHITDIGLEIDNTLIPYSNIKQFWIVHHDKAKALHFYTTSLLNQHIVLELEEQNPFEVAEVLRTFIPETEPNEESFAHRIARKLRF